MELNKIYNECCLVGMSKIADKSIDMILCDLPYGTTHNKWDSILPLDKLWEQYKRIIKDNGAIVLTAQTPFDKVLGVSNLKMLKYEWVWRKSQGTGFLNAKRAPLKNHENILVFYKKAPVYNPQFTKGKAYTCKQGSVSTNYNSADKTIVTKNDGYRYPLTVQDFKVERGLHPTQKPQALFEYLIKTYTNSGDVVLDNCMGSGTTAVAAISTGRQFIGFEVDDDYCEIINDRIKKTKRHLEILKTKQRSE